jgi:hypothetical protein
MSFRILLMAGFLFFVPQYVLAHVVNDGNITYDSDKDGVTDDYDCDPSNSSISALENDDVGDGKDSNCDGVDGIDADGDGYPVNGGLNADCNDLNPDIHPGAVEQPANQVDEDCDGLD